DVEAGPDAVLCQEAQDARHADPGAVLSPRHAPDRFAALAQLAGLVVGIERQCDSATGTARPFGRPQLSACAHPVLELASMRFRPLPRFKIGLWSVHFILLGICAGREGLRAGRSGEIRTHDPQHPMLMRYQAALRSDRGSSATRSIIMIRSGWRNRQGARKTDVDASPSGRRHFRRGRVSPLGLGVARPRRAVIDLVLQTMRGAKNQNAPGTDRHLLARFWIAPDALTFLPDRKAPKRRNLDHLAAFQRAGDFRDHR